LNPGRIVVLEYSASPCTTFLRRCHFCFANVHSARVRFSESDSAGRNQQRARAPSTVGTGFPVRSNSFCVQPTRWSTGDSAAVCSSTSLCGLGVASRWQIAGAVDDGSDAPREIEQPEPVDVLLVLRRHRDAARGAFSHGPRTEPGRAQAHSPVHGAADVPARQERQRVARVDGQRRVLRPDPAPLVVHRVADLQRGDGLAEEQREAAEVCWRA
jgi:hypothetical protein